MHKFVKKYLYFEKLCLLLQPKKLETATEPFMKENAKTIDIEQVVKSKTGKENIPKPLLRWLKKILHEDDMNRFFELYPDVDGMDFIVKALDFINVTIEVHGQENLPDDGRLYTFASNHPLGGPDGLAVGKVIGEHYKGHLRFLVNSFLMALPPLAPLCVPVSKIGGQSRNLPQQVDAVFSCNDQVIMFPAGLCSRKQKGVIRDLPWKKTFVQKSIQYQRDVVPMYFEGRNSNRFYNIANLCKFFHIKFNIAMIFLVDEMFRHKGDTFHLYIGKPIRWQSFDKTRNAASWAQYVKDIVYSLAPVKK